MPRYNNYGYNSWNSAGEGLGDLLAALLLKNQRAAAQLWPHILKKEEESQLRGTYQPLAEVLDAQKPKVKKQLEKWYQQTHGQPAPFMMPPPPQRLTIPGNTLRGPINVEVPGGENVASRTPAWPTSPQDMKARLLQEQMRGGKNYRPPEPFAEEQAMGRAGDITNVQQKNQGAAELLHGQYPIIPGQPLPPTNNPQYKDALEQRRVFYANFVQENKIFDPTKKQYIDIQYSNPSGLDFVDNGLGDFFRNNLFQSKTREELGYGGAQGPTVSIQEKNVFQQTFQPRDVYDYMSGQIVHYGAKDEEEYQQWEKIFMESGGTAMPNGLGWVPEQADWKSMMGPANKVAELIGGNARTYAQMMIEGAWEGSEPYKRYRKSVTDTEFKKTNNALLWRVFAGHMQIKDKKSGKATLKKLADINGYHFVTDSWLERKWNAITGFVSGSEKNPKTLVFNDKIIEGIISGIISNPEQATTMYFPPVNPADKKAETLDSIIFNDKD